MVAHNAVNQALVATAIGTLCLFCKLTGKYMKTLNDIFFSCLLSVSNLSGLGTEYFRVLLQSNCGVSVLDFTPRLEGGSPYICLNRLNQVYGNFMLCNLFL